MLKPEKGMKVMHRVYPQSAIAVSSNCMYEIQQKLDGIVEKWATQEKHNDYVVERKAIIDNICFTNRVERIHGTTHIGADLYADSTFEAIVTYHIEAWSKVTEDVDESDPEIVDVKYYEGGWM